MSQEKIEICITPSKRKFKSSLLSSFPIKTITKIIVIGPLTYSTEKAPIRARESFIRLRLDSKYPKKGPIVNRSPGSN